MSPMGRKRTLKSNSTPYLWPCGSTTRTTPCFSPSMPKRRFMDGAQPAAALMRGAQMHANIIHSHEILYKNVEKEHQSAYFFV